ncbi:tRNA (adenosine(37)-N6)-dimethylallyltransferase MiaA [Savagea faecisuis]|uniref:tRNA dimethylallyltransferase n=1 Tax=Savagea faecisuis TaxID=1274803 RepID=A0ABW3GW63_9BACL
MNKVIAILGPTASGKTALSVALAKHLDGEVINGDSMQIYKELSIGTAKIKEEEKEGIPHHLFDYLEPEASFSVSDYQKLVRQTIDDIQARGKQAIIVGGTGLYVQAVLYDFQFTEQATDETVREAYEQRATEEGLDVLYAELVEKDPESAKTIHPNNSRRIIRALEIYDTTGRTKGEHEQEKGQDVVYPHLLVGLQWERAHLYERINTRVELMVEEGLEAEVEALYKKGLKDAQSMSGIGYKEWIPYFEGKRTKEEVVSLIQRNTRRYAKRQMTYFNNKMDVHWLDATSPMEQKITEIIRRLQEE